MSISTLIVKLPSLVYVKFKRSKVSEMDKIAIIVKTLCTDR